MPKPSPESALGALLVPNLQLDFTSFDELHSFEDLLAPLVDPDFDNEFWEARLRLEKLVRPAGLFGEISDISLTVMDKPYDRLQDARDRGWEFGLTGNNRRTPTKLAVQRYLGFVFRAYAASYGKQRPLAAEVWYAPVSQRPDTFGEGLRRIATKPALDEHAVKGSHVVSRTLGFAALRELTSTR